MFTTRGRVYSPGQVQGTVIKNTGDGTGTYRKPWKRNPYLIFQGSDACTTQCVEQIFSFIINLNSFIFVLLDSCLTSTYSIIANISIYDTPRKRVLAKISKIVILVTKRTGTDIFIN